MAGRVKMNDRAARAALYRAILTGARQVAQHARREVLISINRSNPDGTDPSAPGEPPKKATGTLAKSIATTTSSDGNAVTSLIGSNVPYAPHLEYGTSKMAARPFLRPALQLLKGTALATIARVVGRALK